MEFEEGARKANDFNEAIRVHPKDTSALFYQRVFLNLGASMRKQSRILTKRFVLEPSSVFLLSGRGDVWLTRKELDKAIDDFSAALKVEPTNAYALAMRGRAWGEKPSLRKPSPI